MHLIEYSGNKVCFSKEMSRGCQNSFGKEGQGRQTEFVCVSGPEAKVMERRVLAGDRVEELDNLPTEFSLTGYELTHMLASDAGTKELFGAWHAHHPLGILKASRDPLSSKDE